MTKLDGTSKGGMVVAIQKELGLPVKFIGPGEQPDDLQPILTPGCLTRPPAWQRLARLCYDQFCPATA